jgi:hypothetical protein
MITEEDLVQILGGDLAIIAILKVDAETPDVVPREVILALHSVCENILSAGESQLILVKEPNDSVILPMFVQLLHHRDSNAPYSE